MSTNCLTCKVRIARVKGCCVKDYQMHRRAVRAGLTTWEELERQGKAIASSAFDVKVRQQMGKMFNPGGVL